jgi:hypothetical protein
LHTADAKELLIQTYMFKIFENNPFFKTLFLGRGRLK